MDFFDEVRFPLQRFPSFYPCGVVAEHFGLSPHQFMDRVRQYNKRHPQQPIRRAYGLICLEDLTLLFPEADPEEHFRRKIS